MNLGGSSQNAEGNNINQAGRDIIFYGDFFQKQLPTSIAQIVTELDKVIDIDTAYVPQRTDLYEIQEKIDFNNLIKYKPFVENFGTYGGVVENVYNAIDNEKPNFKKRFLRHLNSEYLLCVGDFIQINPNRERNEVIQENSDAIMDCVLEKLKGNYLYSTNKGAVKLEDLETCLMCIVCKGFIDCKILEAPIK